MVVAVLGNFPPAHFVGESFGDAAWFVRFEVPTQLRGNFVCARTRLGLRGHWSCDHHPKEKRHGSRIQPRAKHLLRARRLPCPATGRQVIAANVVADVVK
jgi:hypothetical protein